MANTLVLIASPVLIGLGVSQMYATPHWQSYYRMLGALGPTGVRLNGLVSLAIGSPIVILHNVWSGPPMLLTLIGWLLLLESTLCLFLPSAGLAGLSEVDEDARGGVIKGMGVVLVVVGGVLGIHVLRSAG
ncbi:MAG: hypothetical protein GKS03_07720 [Alphaproteobacteria bacterium]|nr:hypothetical protein [Alphaproteobacteria bacterium]